MDITDVLNNREAQYYFDKEFNKRIKPVVNEIEVKLIAMEAALKTTILPIWQALTPTDCRAMQISALENMAQLGDDSYTNTPFAKGIADELQRWVVILGEASQSHAAPVLEPVE